MCTTMIIIITGILHDTQKLIPWNSHSSRTHARHSDRSLVCCNHIKCFFSAVTHISSLASMKMNIHKTRYHDKTRCIYNLMRCAVISRVRVSCFLQNTVKTTILNDNIALHKASILCKYPCIFYYHIHAPSQLKNIYRLLSAASSATSVTSLCSCNTEAGTCGVIGPKKALCTISALSSPLATIRIFLACMMVLMPIV